MAWKRGIWRGEWISVNPPPVGVAIVVNINFLEPYNDDGNPVGRLSDSLNMVFTGIAPFPGDLDNVSLDLHLWSDPNAVPLPNAYTLYENGPFQDVTHFVVCNDGPTDVTMLVASSLPEPMSLLLMGRCIGTRERSAEMLRQIASRSIWPAM